MIVIRYMYFSIIDTYFGFFKIFLPVGVYSIFKLFHQNLITSDILWVTVIHMRDCNSYLLCQLVGEQRTKIGFNIIYL